MNSLSYTNEDVDACDAEFGVVDIDKLFNNVEKAEKKVKYVNRVNKLYKSLKVITGEIHLLQSFAPDSIDVDVMMDKRIIIIQKLLQLKKERLKEQ